MMHEQAIVVKVDGQNISLEAERQSTCGHCSAKSGCGTALLDKFFARQPQNLVVKSELELAVGDRVLLGLDESALLKGSFVVYFIPLLLMLLFPVIISQFDFSEIVSILSAITGFLTGMIYVKYFSAVAQRTERFSPVVLKRLNP